MIIRSLHEPEVAVRDLVISFERWGHMITAVDKLSVEVFSGEWVLLVGHNGAGKTTLLRAIAGELRPNAGTVAINGHSVHDLTPTLLAKNVFSVRQDPLLGSAPLLTVIENLFVADSHVRAKRVSKTDLISRYLALLEPIGLAGRMKQPVKLLSGGERQLLALVIAGLREASVVVLDEPLAALDPQKAELCIEQISAMHKQGKTIIQTAHDLSRLRKRADRLITLKTGRLFSNETCSELPRPPELVGT